MNDETFDKIVQWRINVCKAVLMNKNKEYSSDTDRLHNFKKAGQMKGQDPVQALDGMWLKHRVSLEDMLDKLAKDPDYVPSKEYIAEKLGDMINYTLLLEGLIEDRRESIENPLFRDIPFVEEKSLEEKKIEVEAHINKKTKNCQVCNALNYLEVSKCCTCEHVFNGEVLATDDEFLNETPRKQDISMDYRDCPACKTINILENVRCYSCGQII